MIGAVVIAGIAIFGIIAVICIAVAFGALNMALSSGVERLSRSGVGLCFLAAIVSGYYLNGYIDNRSSDFSEIALEYYLTVIGVILFFSGFVVLLRAARWFYPKTALPSYLKSAVSGYLKPRGSKFQIMLALSVSGLVFIFYATTLTWYVLSNIGNPLDNLYDCCLRSSLDFNVTLLPMGSALLVLLWSVEQYRSRFLAS